MAHTKILTQRDIEIRKLVQDAQERGKRATSYDATVGTIIGSDGIVSADSYTLKPRSIAWVISKETYNLPNNITGITTLKTGWTKKGVLTLTVGIVDPNYSGPLSTAVVNFSGTDFDIDKGRPFFRTVFFEHEEVDAPPTGQSRADYELEVRAERKKFSDNFLSVDTLIDEVLPEIFKAPKLAIQVSFGAIVLAIFGLVLPPIWNMGTEIARKNHAITVLQDRVERLESQIISEPEPETITEEAAENSQAVDRSSTQEQIDEE
tara:strand:- start:52 stop:840 length:789 start_codon:yes stop_codon:yes gene_type:complete